MRRGFGLGALARVLSVRVTCSEPASTPADAANIHGMEPFVVAGYGTVEDKAAKLALGMSYVLWGVAVVASFSSLYVGAKLAIAAAYFWGIAEVCLNPVRPSDQSRRWAPALGFFIAVPVV